MLTIREAAERVLFGSTLEEKLGLSPAALPDARAEIGADSLILRAGQLPGRPPGLEISPRGVKADFPGVHHLDDDRERAVLLHFLANHELLAAELMALALLKFPDAPAEYRAGVYAAMREEQMHTLMYMRRMQECGLEFGELPLNDYFWRLVSPAESPVDFITRLNLTFEQANLDFSRHYAGLFRQAGDAATAAVLEKIYRDEIGHVGHGLKWFRHWKDDPAVSDWEAFRRLQPEPLSPARAKGLAPFNAEGRRLAGLDEDFIRQLQLHGQSRGRTPAVAWFNADAENRAMAAISGAPYTPNKFAVALEEDLEILALAWCRQDDIALLRRRPSDAHLESLQRAGLELPEMVVVKDLPALAERKLGGLRPWAWSDDSSTLLAPLAGAISPKLPEQWVPQPPEVWLSKEIGLRLEKLLDCPGPRGELCGTLAEAGAAMKAHLDTGNAVLAKAVHACAGRGHLRIDERSTPEAVRLWLEQALAKHRAVVIEPFLDRVLDFSALYDLSRSNGESSGAAAARLVGMTVMENDAVGRFTGTRVAHKWSTLLAPELAAFLFAKGEVEAWYQQRIPAALPELLPGYHGPVGIDAMVYREPDGALALKVVVEANVRMTMGRVALELRKRPAFRGSGVFRILRRGREGFPELPSGALALNDPGTAKEFLAVWFGGGC